MTTSSLQGKFKQDATVRFENQDKRAGNGQPEMTAGQGIPRSLTIKIRFRATPGGPIDATGSGSPA